MPGFFQGHTESSAFQGSALPWALPATDRPQGPWGKQGVVHALRAAELTPWNPSDGGWCVVGPSWLILRALAAATCSSSFERWQYFLFLYIWSPKTQKTFNQSILLFLLSPPPEDPVQPLAPQLLPGSAEAALVCACALFIPNCSVRSLLYLSIMIHDAYKGRISGVGVGKGARGSRGP